MATRWNIASEMQSRSDIGTGSRETALSMYNDLLGPPTREIKMDRWARVPRTNNQLPDEYVGDNLFLARNTEGLNNNMGTVLVTEVYPMVATDHVGMIEWSTWEFNRGVFHQEPWEGVPQLFTTQKTRRQATIHRKGGGLKFEGDDLASQGGREDYELKFQGLSSVMIETYSLDTLRAIFLGVRVYREEQRGRQPRRLSRLRRLQEEKRRFAVMNIDKTTAGKILVETRQLLEKRNVTGPYIVLAPPGTINMLAIDEFPGAQYRRDNQQMGVKPDGTGYMQKTSPLNRLDLGNGIEIIEIPDLLVEQAGIPTQPLSRNILYGEYALQSLDEQYLTTDYRQHAYHPDWRTIRVKEDDGGYRSMPLSNTLSNANFPDMEVVVTLLENNQNPFGQPWTHQDFDPSRDEHGNTSMTYMGNRHNRRRAHMMMFWDPRHSPLPVRFFGQMDANILPTYVLERMAESLARNCNVSNQKIVELKEFIDLLRSAGGTSDYWQDLAKHNLPFNQDKGRFIGEKLGNVRRSSKNYKSGGEIIKERGLSDIVEWKANPLTGTLRIPTKTPNHGDIPAGFASAAGIKAIARLDRFSSGYEVTLIDQAKRAMETINKLHVHFSKTLDTLVTNPDYRLPWFHYGDGTEMLIDMMFTGPTDPLFLGVPFLKEGTDVESTTMKGSSAIIHSEMGDIKIATTTVPSNLPQKDYSDLIIGEGSVTINGEEIKNAAELAAVLGSPIYRLFSLVQHKGTAEALEKLNNRVRGFINPVDWNDMVSFLINTTNNATREKIIVGLYAKWIESAVDFSELISTILGGLTRKRGLKKSKTMLREIIQLGENKMNTDSFDKDEYVTFSNLTKESKEGLNLLASDVDKQLEEWKTEKTNTLEDLKKQLRDEKQDPDIATYEEFDGTDNTGINAYVTDLNKLGVRTDTVDDDTFINAIRDLENKIYDKEQNSGNIETISTTLVRTQIKSGQPITFYRAPLVMSPGIEMFLESAVDSGYPLYVLPSDPASGHTTPITSGKLSEKVRSRPSYVGANVAKIEDSIFHTTLAESFQSNKMSTERTGSRKDRDIIGAHFGDVLGAIAADPDERYTDETDDLMRMMYEEIGDDETTKESWEAYLSPSDTHGFGAFGSAMAVYPNLHDMIKTSPTTYEDVAAQLTVGNVAWKLEHANTEGDDLVKLCMIAIIFARCDENRHWMALESYRVLSPCVGLLVWPAVEKIMGSLIMLKPGPETGMNIIGNLNTWVNGHGNTKTVLVHVTHTAATITRTPKNIVPMSNVMALGVVSGGGTSFITDLKHIFDPNPENRRDVIPEIISVLEYDLPKDISATGYMSQVDDNPGPVGQHVNDIFPQYSSAQYLGERLVDRNDGTSLSQIYAAPDTNGYDDLVGDSATFPNVWSKKHWIDWAGDISPSASMQREGTVYIGSERTWSGIQANFSINPTYPKRPLIGVSS